MNRFAKFLVNTGFTFAAIVCFPALANGWQQTTTSFESHLETFVTRRGAKLFEGDKEFRFLSFDIPELIMREEPYWGFNHQFEQADALKTIRAFGGRVTRCYVMSIASPEHPEPRHIIGPQQYNEDVFRSMDQALVECNNAGVRLIVPFIDNWKWWGGIAEFAALRGKTVQDFFADPQLKADYKHLVSYVLNRKNTISGIAYKDDPAILGWETGNELRSAPGEWTLEMAQYIKSIDANHLVIDGNDHSSFPEVLASPDIDVVVKHYYRGSETDKAIVDYEQRFRADIAAIKGQKPFLIGEFGFAPTDEFIRFANAVVDSDGVGAMLWSLRQHEFQGGFRWHVEATTGFAAYHWPGFPSGDKYNEQTLLKKYHAAALRMQGLDQMATGIPETPTLLPIETVYDIRWRGSVGATGYNVQRSEGDGDWKTIAENVSDSVNSPQTVVTRNVVDAVDGIQRSVRQHVFMQDLAVETGKTCWYRVSAVNESGASPWSDAVSIEVNKQSGFENVDFAEKRFQTPFQIGSQGMINSIILVGDKSLSNDRIEVQVSADGRSFVPVPHEFSKSKLETTFYIGKIPDHIQHIRIVSQNGASLVRLQYAFGEYRVRIPDQ